MKRTIFVTVLLTMLLCACGDKAQESTPKKEETKESVEINFVEKDESEEPMIPLVPPNKEEIPTKSTQTPQQTTQQATRQEVIQQQTPQKEIQEEPKEEPKKRVDSFSEIVTGTEYPFKYGVTKYEWRCNYVALFNDGSKEILDYNIETRYNKSKYYATCNDLRAEAEQKTNQYIAYYKEVLRLVNEERVKVGAGPLTLDLTMCKAATMRSMEMDYSGIFSHTRPNGTSCFTVLDYYGVESSAMGENLTGGPSTPAAAVQAWKNSPGHYQAMINPEFTRTGIGFCNVGLGGYKNYWCQLFAK